MWSRATVDRCAISQRPYPSPPPLGERVALSLREGAAPAASSLVGEQDACSDGSRARGRLLRRVGHRTAMPLRAARNDNRIRTAVSRVCKEIGSPPAAVTTPTGALSFSDRSAKTQIARAIGS